MRLLRQKQHIQSQEQIVLTPRLFLLSLRLNWKTNRCPVNDETNRCPTFCFRRRIS
jgi:hypothetical protein